MLLAAFGPRMLRTVARYAETWNAFGKPDEMRERNQLLDHYCQEAGRDPNSLTRSLYCWAVGDAGDPWASVQAFHDFIGPYLECGMNQFLIDQPGDGQLATLERVATDVLPALRAAGTADREPVSAPPGRTATWSRPADYV
jgi:alkanesulfonate monooxygenase SsuD/methylene tetrahydromethanopterin reductase-like flavin-dependent oxidoreductase (luciferase family)